MYPILIDDLLPCRLYSGATGVCVCVCIQVSCAATFLAAFFQNNYNKQSGLKPTGNSAVKSVLL